MWFRRKSSSPRPEPSSMREEQDFLADSLPPIGREEDKRTILDLLRRDGNHVVTIHGKGGSGKTKLAKLVHDEVDERHKKIRICVSDSFEFGKVIKKIFDGLGEGITGRETVDQLEVKLQNRLGETSLLVVLDDLRSNDEGKWRELANLLMKSFGQVKIVVTTREQSVVNMIDTVSTGMGTVSSHPLEVLSVKHLLELFERYAVRKEQNEILPPELKKIGEKIVAKCEGLPLAVKILASCLSENRDATDWQNICDKSNFELLLKLSRDLPVYCKDRFFYFSPLLQHKSIEYEDLFDLWMTDGLFETLDQEMSVMVVEKELKSIIEEGHRDVLSGLICHPTIIRRLTENQWPVINASNYEVGGHAVHLSISGEHLNRLGGLKGVETLFIWVAPSKLFSKKLVSKFGPLRMLVLKRSTFELPSSMCGMTHLKCLNLKWNSMEKFPKFIFKQKNLEILKLEGCGKLKELPEDIKELKGLKVLSITAKKIHSPSAIKELKSLQSLLLRDCEASLPIGMYLTSLTALQSLTIYGCHNLDFTEDGDNKSLLELKLENIQNLEALPLRTTCLRHLHIKNCKKLNKLPDSLLGFPLERIVIDDCSKLLSLPAPMPQLQSLRNLKIRYCTKLKKYVSDIMEEEYQRQYFSGKLDILDDQ